MNRLFLLGVATLTVCGLAASGCSSDSKASGTGGSGNNGGDTGMDTGGGTGMTDGTGGTTGTGAATGGATSTAGGAGACGTTNGTFSQTSAFATTLEPYAKNAWQTGMVANLELVTTAPNGIDCSAGCAHLSAEFPSGTPAYWAGAIEQYFGDTSSSAENLLNETITLKLAAVVTRASGATADPPVTIDLTGYDTFTTTTYVDNLWVHNLGSLASLASVTTIPYKIVDAQVPDWSPTRTVCASGLHTLSIRVQNSTAIDATNAGTIDLYIQSIAIAP